MTTDPFTEAARAEAGRRWRDPALDHDPIGMAVGLALWARDHLAAHDARVRRDAAREALDGLAAEAREGIANREITWGHGQSIASAAETYRDTHYPETEDQT